MDFVVEPMLEHHLPLAFDRQLLLAELVEDLPWSFELQTGILSFGNRFHWKAEVLGTESEETSTWLWAWANKASNIPPEQQAASLKLKALGEKQGIAEFTEPMVPQGDCAMLGNLRHLRRPVFVHCHGGSGGRWGNSGRQTHAAGTSGQL